MPGHGPRSQLIGILILGLILGGCSKAEPSDTSRLPASADPGYNTSLDDPSHVGNLADDADPSSTLKFPKPYGLDPIIRSETHVVTASEGAGLTTWTATNASACTAASATRPKCEYDFVLDPVPAGVAVGSVLASGELPKAPYGFLVKITSLSGTSGHAVEASLGDAVEQGEFRGDQQMDPAKAVDVSLAQGVTRAPTFGTAPLQKFADTPSSLLSPFAPVRPQNTGNSYDYNVDTNQSGVHFVGSLHFAADCGVSAGLTYKWHIIPNGAYFIAGCGINESVAVDITVATDKKLDPSELAVVDLGSVTFFIGPVPVVILFRMHIYAALDGKVFAGVTYGASEQANFGVSFGYHKGCVANADFSVSAEKHSVTSGPEIDVSGVVGADVRGMVYGIVGAGLGGATGIAIKGKPLTKPLWCLSIIGTMTASVSLDLGIKSFTWGPQAIYSKEFPVSCAENSPPELVIGYPKDGSTYQLAGIMVEPYKAYGNDPEDGSLPVTWTSDLDGPLGTTTQSGGLLSKMPSTPGPQVLTLTTTDLDGKQTSTQLHITVTTPVWGLTSTLYDLSMNELPRTGTSGYTGQTVYLKAVPKPPAGSMQPACKDVVWSTPGLTFTKIDDCMQSVVLPAPGTYTVTLQINPFWGGSPIVEQRTITVTKPPAVIPPQVGFTVTGNSGRVFTNGGMFVQGETLTLTGKYVNASQAGATLSYTWTYSVDGASPESLTGGQDTTSGSVRSYVRNESKSTHTVVFTCTVRNTATSAVVTKFTMSLTYQGSPA